MGQGQSTGKFSGTEGYHVLKVGTFESRKANKPPVADSPAEKAGLRAYFDYILAVNDTRLDQESNALADAVQKGMETEVSLAVYSAKTQQVRQVVVKPSQSWGGSATDGSLGCVARFCSFDQADQHCWRVLEVLENSPTWMAGLTADADYIIGSANALLKDRDDLFHLVESFAEKPLRLFVYNTVFDSCREIQIVPSRGWGGEGLLGCSLGYGYLHKLSAQSAGPGQIAKQVKTPIETKPAPSHGHDHAAHSHDHHGHAAGRSHDHGDAGHSHDQHSHSHDQHGHSHGQHGHSHDHHSDVTDQKHPVSQPAPTNQTADETVAAIVVKQADTKKTENESIL